MKKFYLLLVVAVTVCLFIKTKTNSSSHFITAIKDEPLSEKFPEREMEQTDEPDRISHRDFIMTMDPATGTVPVERLQLVEQRIQQQQNSRVLSSNITWEERGPSNIGGRTRAILIDQNDATGNTVWVGGVGGGLWKTTNFKTTATWTQMTAVSANLAITCIAQDPQTPATIYVGTGEGHGNIDAIRGLGIYKTTNSGGTWTLLPITTTGGADVDWFNYVQKILVYPNAAHDVYAATRSRFCNGNSGILRSSDGGTTWTRVLGTSGGSCATSSDATGYDIEKSLSGDLYVATKTPTSTGHIFKSVAGGTVGNSGTWVNVTPAGTFQRIEIACSPTNNLKIYASTQGASNATGGLRVSSDGGTSWANIDITSWCDQGSTVGDFTRNQAWYDLMLAIKPTDDGTVYAGGIDIFKTTNSGAIWNQLTQWNSSLPCLNAVYVHADIHELQFFPGSPDEFLVGCDGGLFYTTNGGTTFTNKNSGYNVTQYYGADIHPTSGSDYMLAGAQDNGSHKFTAPGINAVTTATGGDGTFCHIKSDNPNFQFTSFTGCTFNRSANAGSTWSTIISVAADRFVNPSEYDPSADVMYCGAAIRNFRHITAMTGAATSSSFPNVASANLSVSALKLDPNTPNRVWAAFSQADQAAAVAIPEIYIVDNADGASPTFTPVTLPVGIAASSNYISSLDIETGNSNHVILTLSNFGVNSVWETTNGGTSWTSIEGDLPDMPVRWCKFAPAGFAPNTRTQSVGGILLATEMGVWSTAVINAGSTSWVANNAVMGNVRADMIVMRASDKKLLVATHGRGLFTGTFSGVLPVVLTDFTGQLVNNNRNVQLDWHTESEYNSDRFELERSYDGANYMRIATVTAAGNSNRPLHYSFLDKEKLSEKNYYRLKMIDKDNSYKWSSVVLIKLNNVQQDMIVLGNPFNQAIHIRFVKLPTTKIDLKLYDIEGKLVSQKQYGQSSQPQIEFNLAGVNLGTGSYILEAQVDGKIFTAKLVKQ